MMAAAGPAKPLLPDHPPLLTRQTVGERTVYVSPELLPGMERARWSLGDFVLTKELYKGKASRLYQAADKVSGQVEREIRLHGQLRHPHIIQLHAAFEDATHVFMVCEFATGGDLYQDLKQAGGLLKERVVAGEVLPPFMDALAHMHAASIVHRDIKPENILLTGARSIRVADFGLSINWVEERPVTRAGTLDYMSPEVLQCPEKSKPEENKERLELSYGEAVDVWAVGILAYELLVGKPPFERETREETYACIQRREPHMPANVSQAARDFILAALAKNPRKRPSMADLLRHPWIGQHSRRPSAAQPMRTSDIFQRLSHALLSPAANEGVHRASLHGANSMRDFSALLATPSQGPQVPAAGSLHPTVSIASNLVSFAATANFDAPPGRRPTTGLSRMGQAASTRPDTPSAEALAALPEVAELEAALPASAFGLPAGLSGQVGSGSGSHEASSSAERPQGSDRLLWSAAAAQSDPGAPAFREAVTSSSSSSSGRATTARLLTSAAGVSSDACCLGAVSSSGCDGGRPLLSLTACAATIKPRAPTSTRASQHSPAPVLATVPQQCAFWDAYRSLALAPAAAAIDQDAAHPHQAQLFQHVLGDSRAGTAAALPPLQQQQQQQQQQHDALHVATPPAGLGRLPALHKAVSRAAAQLAELAAESVPALLPAQGPLEGEEALGAVAAAAAATAAVLDRVSTAVALDDDVQRAGDSTSRDFSKSGGGTAGTAHTQPQAAAPWKAKEHAVLHATAQTEAVAASRKIQAKHAAAHAILPAASAASTLGQQGSGKPGPRLPVQAHLETMGAGEHQHLEKLRAGMPSGETHHEQSSRHSPAGNSSSSSNSYVSGFAKSASSLYNKLLGRRPASTDAAGAAHAGSNGGQQALEAGQAQLVTPRLSRPSQRNGSANHPMRLQQLAGAAQHASGTLPSPATQAARLPESNVGRAGAALGNTLLRSSAQRPLPGRVVPAARKPEAAEVGGSQQLHSVSPSAHRQSTVRDGSEVVESVNGSKAALLAGLDRAGTSAGELDGQGGEHLIAAFHSPSGASSFTSAVSSLPSLTVQVGPCVTPRAGQQDSLSPIAGQSSSHHGAAAGRVSAVRMGRSAGGLGGSRMRRSKVVSTPGDTGSGAAAAAALQDDSCSAEEEAAATVQRTAASWSHSAGGKGKGGSPPASSTQEKLMASAARLGMYRQMLKGGGRIGRGRAP
ncbi:Aurora kinase A [Chlorella vulgaris]